jgi:hypothetical protein
MKAFLQKPKRRTAMYEMYEWFVITADGKEIAWNT